MISMACGRLWRDVASLSLALLSCILNMQGVMGVDFASDIRPLLSDNCFACHGPDEAKRKAGLRLDLKEGAFAVNPESGQSAVVPGDADASSIIERILTQDQDDVMPPPDSGKYLTDGQKELIRQWIDEGAIWGEHWAFRPIQSPQIPEAQIESGSKDIASAENPIDLFVRHKLAGAGLTPSPEAEKHDLIRRVTFDLTGLPPTMDEVREFVDDSSDQAYDRVVERLLRSEHFGEHMARFWLDAVRYGDTHGLHLDNYREIWPYRDWVIQAFNGNLPHDDFITHQLAGDLLEDPDQDMLVATGFNRSHVTTGEGGSITEEVYVRNVVERVVATGTVFMGLTLDCTRCHNHKFDPLTMDDFYSMFAFFNSLDGNPMDGNRKDHAPVIRVPSLAQQKQLADLDASIKELDSRLVSPWPSIDSQQKQWEDNIRNGTGADSMALKLSQWHSVGPFNEIRRYQLGRNQGPEGKPIDLNEQFELSTGEMIGWSVRPQWVDGKVHTDLGGDVAANFLFRTIEAPTARKIRLSLGSDDGIKVYLNGKRLLSRDVSRGAAADQEMLEVELNQGTNELLLKIMNFGGGTGFYFAIPGQPDQIPQEIAGLIEAGKSNRSPEQNLSVTGYFRSNVCQDEELSAVRLQLEKLRDERNTVDRAVPTTLVWKEKSEPKPSFILNRGEYDQRGREVTRRTPAFLPPMKPEFPKDRLGLAQWLIMDENPLTARVAVNRLWQQFFGTGLVKTSEDFGSQGEPPVNPALLDWLASEFRSSGWDVKNIVKTIVMSSTYRQSSRIQPGFRDRDRENRLLSRGPRFRLDAEMLRDQALSLGGLLVADIGGPPVKPPQPDGLWFAVGYSGSNTVRFTADTDPQKTHRRSLYTFHKRTAPPPQMSTFDGPSREACVMRRERTNTPMQALLLMNDPQFVEAAVGLAARALNQAGGGVESVAEWMFENSLFRRPTPAELNTLTSAFEAQKAAFEADPEAARALVETGNIPDAGPHTEAEKAAWTMVANMILNSDEIITKN